VHWQPGPVRARPGACCRGRENLNHLTVAYHFHPVTVPAKSAGLRIRCRWAGPPAPPQRQRAQIAAGGPGCLGIAPASTQLREPPRLGSAASCPGPPASRLFPSPNWSGDAAAAGPGPSPGHFLQLGPWGVAAGAGPAVSVTRQTLTLSIQCPTGELHWIAPASAT